MQMMMKLWLRLRPIWGIHEETHDHQFNHEIDFRGDDSMEAKTFSISMESDFSSTLAEMAEFGASIIAVADLPFYDGSEENVIQFDKVFSRANHPVPFTPPSLFLTIGVLHAVLRWTR